MKETFAERLARMSKAERYEAWCRARARRMSKDERPERSKALADLDRIAGTAKPTARRLNPDDFMA